MFKKRIKKSRATWLGLLLRKGNSRSRSRKQHSERGIAIPLVIGVGLLMLLLSITIIVRSQSSRINSIGQSQSAQAAEVAESGMSQVQSVLAAYVELSRISLANIDPANKVTTWSKAAGVGSAVCPIPGSSPSASTLLNSLLKKDTTTLTEAWANPYKDGVRDLTRQFRILAYDYQPINSSGVTQPGTISTMGSGLPLSITANSTTPITNIVIPTYSSLSLPVTFKVYGQIAGIPGDLEVIASNVYQFTPASRTSDTSATTITSVGSSTIPANNIFYPISTGNANTDSGIATLKVEGQVLSGLNVLAKSVLQAKIPVSPGKIDSIPVPGPWAGENYDDTDIGNQTFNGNFLVSCTQTKNGVTSNTVVSPNRVTTATPPNLIRRVPIALPKIPAAPATAATVSSTANLILPVPGSGYNPSTKSYDYIINGNISSQSISVNPNYRVSIYLSGNIDKGSTINHTKNGPPASDCPTSTCLVTATARLRRTTSPTTSAFSVNTTATTTTGNGANAVTTVNPTRVTPFNDSGSDISSTYFPSGVSSVSGILSISGSGSGQLGDGISGTLSKSGSDYSFTPNTTTSAALPNVPADSTFTPTKSYKSTDFRIFGTSTATNAYICINGNNSIDAYILGPNYSFGVAGGGNSTGVTGAVWVKTIPAPSGQPASCSSNSNKTIVTTDTSWDDLGSAFFPQFLPPTFGATQTWQKNEVN